MDQFGNYNGGEPNPTPNLPPSFNGGTAQVLRGTFANPNGNITPPVTAQGALYSQDNANPVSFWSWSVNSQSWFPIVS